jgi:hypothetical protein
MFDGLKSRNGYDRQFSIRILYIRQQSSRYGVVSRLSTTLPMCPGHARSVATLRGILWAELRP